MGMTMMELTEAIRQHIDMEMDPEVAGGMAEHALGFFGFYDRIIDNALEPTEKLEIRRKILLFLDIRWWPSYTQFRLTLALACGPAQRF